MKICTKCNFANDDDALFCENCGQTLAEPIPESEDHSSEDKTKKCPVCGKSAQDNDLFCKECGTRLKKDTKFSEEDDPEQNMTEDQNKTDETVLPMEDDVAGDKTAVEDTDKTGSEKSLQCPVCHSRIRKDDTFCKECGSRIETLTGETEKTVPKAIINICNTDGDSLTEDSEKSTSASTPAFEPTAQDDISQKCPVCNSKIQDGDMFCKECGHHLKKESEAFENKESEVICPNCQTVNPEDSAFCYKCGAPLKKEAAKSSRKKIWIAVAVIVAVIVVGGGLGYSFYSKSAGQEEEVVAANDKKSAEFDEDQKDLSDSDKSEEPVEEPSEEPVKEQQAKPDAMPVPQNDEATPASQNDKVDSNSISLPVTPVKKEESNYSGPACAQMLLKSLGYDFSQQQFASMSGVKPGGIADYRNLATAITMQIATTPISAEYKGTYLSGNEITQSAKDTFLSKLNKNLEDGFPTIIVTIVPSFSGAPESSYGIITGRTTDSSGQRSYRVIVPKTDGVIDIWQTTDELLEGMTMLNTFCYLS